MTSLVGKTIKKCQDDIIKELSTRYPHLDFSRFIYKNNLSKGIVTCKIHNYIFEENRKNITRTKSGGCRYCSRTGPNAKKTKEEFKVDLRNKFGKEIESYDISNIDYIDALSVVDIICPDHGKISRTPNYFLSTNGATPCPLCNRESKSIKQYDSLEDFVYKFEEKYGPGKIIFNDTLYLGSKLKASFKCISGHTFLMRPNDLMNRGNCPSCVESGTSSLQLEIEEFLSEHVNFLISRYRLRNNKEVDILLPEYNLAIEFNGIYWHREEVLGKKYHLDKLEYCKSIGLRLIQIFEDEWLRNKDIVKSRLLHFVKKSSKIYARKTSLKEISYSVARSFLDNNHIQGSCFSPINIGLFSEGALVAVMTFGELRFNNNVRPNEYELIRYCSTGGIIGGFSKLLKYFNKTYSPKRILSYSDKRWSIGEVYEKNGFSLIGSSEPAVSWCKNQVRLSRFQTMKFRLKKWEGYSENITAEQILTKNGWYKIWDCGCDRWEMIL